MVCPKKCRNFGYIWVLPQNLKSGVYLMQRIQDFLTKIKKAKEGSANYELLQ